MLSEVNNDEAGAEGRWVWTGPVAKFARTVLSAALEAEVEVYLAELVDERDEDGHRLVTRKGHVRQRKIQTVAGASAVAHRRQNPGPPPPVVSTVPNPGRSSCLCVVCSSSSITAQSHSNRTRNGTRLTSWSHPSADGRSPRIAPNDTHSWRTNCQMSSRAALLLTVLAWPGISSAGMHAWHASAGPPRRAQGSPRAVRLATRGARRSSCSARACKRAPQSPLLPSPLQPAP